MAIRFWFSGFHAAAKIGSDERRTGPAVPLPPPASELMGRTKRCLTTKRRNCDNILILCGSTQHTNPINLPVIEIFKRCNHNQQPKEKTERGTTGTSMRTYEKCQHKHKRQTVGVLVLVHV